MRFNPDRCMSCGKPGRSTTDVAFFFCDDWCYREELNKLLPEGRKTYSTFYLGPWQTEEEYIEHEKKDLGERYKADGMSSFDTWLGQLMSKSWMRRRAKEFMEGKRKWDAEQQSWIEYAEKQIRDQVTAEDQLYKAKQHEKERIALERRQAQERRDQQRQAERDRREQERARRETERTEREKQREQERAAERQKKEAERLAENERWRPRKFEI
jgi:colicin import membrane protein